VRENPEAILLMRGLEQAHPALQRLLLHVLERGRLEDMLGEVVFDKTLIFVTLTLPREELAIQEIGFGRPTKTAETRLREVVGRFVLPDLIDAFHEILELPPLSIPEVRQIAQYKVDKVLRRMAQKKTSIAISPSVYDELITDDMCRHGGAKFLNRTLEQRLFNPLARYLLENRTSREIHVGINHGDIVIATESVSGLAGDIGFGVATGRTGSKGRRAVRQLGPRRTGVGPGKPESEEPGGTS
jgi:ATP-dependent Clp protease ATP-binding subunit ClpA